MKIDTDLTVFDRGLHRKLRVIVSIQAFDVDKDRKIINEGTLYCCLKTLAYRLCNYPQPPIPDKLCQKCGCSPCGCGLSITSGELAEDLNYDNVSKHLEER